MGQSETDALVYEAANYEDWNVLSMERRVALDLGAGIKTQHQLQYMLEEGDDGQETQDITT
jgi:hypothetical protein